MARRLEKHLSDGYSLGFDPVCSKIGHDIDVTFPDIGIGYCRRCPGMQIDLRYEKAKEDAKTRAKYGAAVGDYIRTDGGDELFVFSIRENCVLCKIPGKIGDGSEVFVPFGAFTVTKTFQRWWNEQHPDKQVEEVSYAENTV